MADILQRFLNDTGQLIQWPAKQQNQSLVLAYLASKFEADRVYTEHEINDVLNQWHTYGDWATLRRALVDHQFLSRDREGTSYRLSSYVSER